MNWQAQFTAILTVIMLMAGCSNLPQASNNPTPLPISTADLVIASTFPAPVGGQSDSQIPEGGCPEQYSESKIEKPSYQLAVDVNLYTHVLDVQEAITYPNTAEEGLNEMRIVVDPNWREGVFHLDHLSIGGIAVSETNLSGGFLKVSLDPSLPPGCSVTLHLGFQLVLPNQAGIFGYTDHQTVLTNWFPFVPPYQSGEGWLTHTPVNFGEHLVYPSADFELALTISPSAGEIAIAAPAVPIVDGATTTFVLENARTFSFAILEDYQSMQTQEDGITTTVYYRTANPRAARAALQTMQSAANLFSARFGPYPFEALTLAELEMFDGMEYDGIFFLGQDIFATYLGTPQNLLTLLTAHETAHNWWFSQVGNDQALEPWLDEALATYCELFFLENSHPELAGWWWDFRVNSVDPSGLVRATIYTYSNYERYRQAVYLRGVQFIHAVREETGDDLFFEFLRKYYEAGRDQMVSSDVFFEVLEEVYPPGIDALRWKYFASR